MKFKRFLVGFLTFLVVTGAFYFVGEQFSIAWLMFSYEYESSAEGFYFSANSFMPIVFGVAASFIAEKIYVKKEAQKKLHEV